MSSDDSRHGGLPYANVGDAELRARMDHLDEGVGNHGRGRAYYEALCMRGVNQSVGRAIRRGRSQGSFPR